MITKEKIGKELYVYIYKNGKKDLLYKRWINLGYGRVFSGIWGSFTCKEVDVLKLSLRGR